MRRDVFIQNDSGGLSVLAAAAADAIIADCREDDQRFVNAYQAMLLELYGDDSMPVRVVVDEPLQPEEEAQWLARASWRIDAPDGRVLVMGGFDPDVLASWKEEAETEGGAVAVVMAAPGSWRVDIYAHVGSMNGRQILSEHDEQPGRFFRRSHPASGFPLWFAKMLEFSGEEDPGHEDLWSDVAAAMADGRLRVDTEPASAVGFLVHLTRFTGSLPEPPEGGWFAREAGRRVPDVFPLGLAASVADPELEGLLDRLLERSRPAEPQPGVTRIVEIIEAWRGDPLRRLVGGERALALANAFHLHWLMALTSESPPRFELWVTTKGSWTPPAASPEYAVIAKSAKTWAIGPPSDAGGWLLWKSARRAALAIADVPEGSTIELAMAPQDEATANPGVGLAIFGGDVKSGLWHVSEASPAVSAETLGQALDFVHDLAEAGRISVRGDGERRAIDVAAAIYSPEAGSLIWEDDGVRLAEPEERTLLILAARVFRRRFSADWPCDPIDDDDSAE